MFLPVVILLLVAYQNAVGAHNMQINITTLDRPASPGAPNTFIATGKQIASSLLESDSPALLWGVVDSKDVNAVCEHIMSTGNLTFSAIVDAHPSWGRVTDTLDLKAKATEACLAADDGSGTEALVSASDGLQVAVICPPTEAGSSGCGVYYVSDDVTRIYSQGRSLASTTPKKLFTGERGAALTAIITVAVSGPLGLADCGAMRTFKPFCKAGVMGVSLDVVLSPGAHFFVGNGPHCFPGDATVLLANGQVKYMAGLQLGEKVAVRNQDGGVAYDDIYAFGHKHASASGHFIQLSLQPRGWNFADPVLEAQSRILELTALHFAQVSSGPAEEISYRRAQDIRVGDVMWAQSSSADAVTSPYVVTGVSAVVKQGLYNPFTLSGTIIVNGVATSSYSEWLWGNTFRFLGLTHRLPNAYQAILSPVRTLYFILGIDAYISLYNHMDALINIVDFGTNHGGQLVTLGSVSIATSSIFAAVLISKLSKWRANIDTCLCLE